MDPLTALSVAGTIVQFVDFGNRLLSAGTELYKSSTGRLKVDEELVLVTTDLKAVINKVQRTNFLRPSEASGCLSDDDQADQNAFEKICSNALEVAKELHSKLDKLRLDQTPRKRRRWGTMVQVVSLLWSGDEINGLCKRLSALREALQTRVLLSTLENLDAHSVRVSGRLDSLDNQTQQIISSLLSSNQTLSRDIAKVVSLSLVQFLCRMQALNGDEHRHTRDMIVQMREAEDNRRLGALSNIKAQIEMLDVAQSTEHILQSNVQAAILQDLSYTAMTNRYETLAESYPKTYDWAFQKSTDEQLPWDNFSVWLKSGRGVYWVSGKPGSGKSTLMKYIFDDPRTHSYLETWAETLGSKGAPLCIATFFFWNSGTTEQRSHTGMLRALLFQVLNQHPELIVVLFPVLWSKHYTRAVNNEDSILTEPWSERVLIRAFNALLTQKEVPLNLCLLVDGLDEFEGDHEELAGIFSNLAESGPSNVKVCVASRPWVVFKDSFSTCPSLQLHNLTFNDIERFVGEKFRMNNAFDRLARRDPKAANALIRNVVEKADGVFLWVRIVVKDILRGIRNLDNFSHLYARLNTLPKDLEPLFAHLINQIEPIYLVWASKAFQIIRTVRKLGTDPKPRLFKTRPSREMPVTRKVSTFRQKLRTNSFVPLDLKEHDSTGDGFISVFELYLALDEDLDYDGVLEISGDELITRCQQTEVHLAMRTALLLEVAVSQKHPEVGPNCPVQYLHRTARDFLEEEERWKWFSSLTEGSGFNPHVSMMWCHNFNLQRISSLDSTDPTRLTMAEVATNAIIHATYADTHSESHGAQVHILDNIDTVMTKSSTSRSLWYKCLDYDIVQTRLVDSFLDLTLFLNISCYVSMKVANANPPPSSVKEDATLALSRRIWGLLGLEFQDIPHLSFELAAALLALGADVNLAHEGHTTWTRFVFRHGSSEENSQYFKILSLFLSYGANAQASGYDSMANRISIRDFIIQTMSSSHPIEAAKFISELDQAL